MQPDSLLVLGGQKNTSRTDAAVAAYCDYGKTLPIICSGGVKRGHQSEARIMRELLLRQGVSDDDILLEEQSLDTLGNLYFSKPLLYDCQVSHVGIVTDPFHLPRAMYCANVLFSPDKFTALPVPSTQQATLRERLQEAIIHCAQALDLSKVPLDAPHITKYMQEKHPLYGSHPSGFYSLLTRVARKR